MNPRFLATIGLIIGIFLEALEGTVVATAMPAIVGHLGNARLYALPFSIYLLAQTVSSPLWGRVSDSLRRKPLYLAGIGLYLAGSALSGAARTMHGLIAMRVVQGLGAGCVMTLTFTLIGGMFALEQRARVQGYISAVWGVAGLLGPLIGGLIVDHASWRWVFYLNIPFGIVAFALCAAFLEETRQAQGTFRLDLPGSVLLILGIGAIVWGLDQKWALLALGGLCAVGLALPFELRHPAPLLPIRSLRHVIVRSSLLNNLLAGAAYFGAVAYIPLFVHRIADAAATTAGIVLTPMVVGWTITSIIGGRILSKVRLATLNIMGFSLLTVGFAGMALFIHSGLPILAATGLVIGFGMGFGMLTTLLMVQENSPRSDLGAATAAAMYARTIGGALGVSLLSILIVGASASDPIAGFQKGFFLCFLLATTALAISIFKIRGSERGIA